MTSRALGQDMQQQCRRPAEVARAVARPGSGIEVLPKSGTCRQRDDVVTQPLRQRFLAMRSESFGQQPRGVEPGRPSPVEPGIITPVCQIKARHSADSRLAGTERWSCQCGAQSVAHTGRQSRQHQRDQAGDRTLCERSAGPHILGQKHFVASAP